MSPHQIIQSFKQASTHIVGINSFMFATNLGQLDPNTSNNLFYPCLQLESPIVINDGQTPTQGDSYSISFNILDRPMENNLDQDFERSKTFSNCYYLGLAVVEVLKKNLKPAPFNASVTLNSTISIIDEQADNLTGARFEVTINCPKNINICEIADDGISLFDYLNPNRLC